MISLQQVFGNTTMVTSTQVVIPRTSLRVSQLRLPAVASAVLLRVHDFFEGSIIDSDDAVLVDNDTASLVYNGNNVDLINFAYINTNIEDTVMFVNFNYRHYYIT